MVARFYPPSKTAKQSSQVLAKRSSDAIGRRFSAIFHYTRQRSRDSREPECPTSWVSVGGDKPVLRRGLQALATPPQLGKFITVRFSNRRGVTTSRLTTAYRTRHPSLGNQSPLPGPLPGWKTRTHKRYISKDRSLLKVLEQAVLKSDAEARRSRSPSLKLFSIERIAQKKSQHSPSDVTLHRAPPNSSSR